MSTLKAWRQVVSPHEDIRRGRFDASVFAADLGEVMAGRGAVDYRDAAAFFGKTYLTKGLAELLTGVVRRLSGHKDGEPVMQMQTQFSGGKTHTLLAIYHLLNDPKRSVNLAPVKRLIADADPTTVPTAGVRCLFPADARRVEAARRHHRASRCGRYCAGGQNYAGRAGQGFSG